MTIHELNNTSYLFQKDHVNNWAYQTKVFTKTECESIINYGNSYNKNKALIGSENPLNENIRKSNVAWIYPNSETFEIYERLSNVVQNLNNEFFKFDLFGFCEGLQFTEYKSPDGHYKAHLDSMTGKNVRKLSIVLQLSDPKDYEGGNLLIYQSNDPTFIHQEQGTLIAFPSYMLHQVAPVTKGIRYSLVAWITGPNFK